MQVARRFGFMLVLFAFILSACGPAAADEPVLRYGWTAQPDTLNPGQAELAESYVLFRLVYDSMYEYNADGTFSLELAESVNVSPDGRVWTFKIRDGIKWHDGEPLTADDVVFTYRFYTAHQEFPYMPGYTASFEDVQSTPDNEVVITFLAPITNVEALLFDMFILPAHIWSPLSFEAAAAYENAEMIGSGPFKFSGQTDNVIRLEANRDHYLYKTQLDSIEFVYIENPADLTDALTSGKVDALYQVPVEQVETLKQAANVEVVTGAPTAPGVSDIIINQVLEEDCPFGSICSGHPALRDRQVRLAMAYATDKQKIIETVMLGFATPGLTLIPPGLGEFFNDQIQDYPYDVAAANTILDEAGYLDVDGDGIRDMPDGSRAFTLRVSWPDDVVTAGREAELLKEMWSQIGIDVVLEAKSPDEVADTCCPAFDYDILLWAWGSDPDPDFLLSVPTSSGIETGLNETGYSNAEYDALYLQQQTTFDHDERRAIVWKMQEIMHSDVIYIIPYYDIQVQAYRTDRFTGWLTNSATLSLERLSNIVQLKPVQ